MEMMMNIEITFERSEVIFDQVMDIIRELVCKFLALYSWDL